MCKTRGIYGLLGTSCVLIAYNICLPVNSNTLYNRSVCTIVPGRGVSLRVLAANEHILDKSGPPPLPRKLASVVHLWLDWISVWYTKRHAK